MNRRLLSVLLVICLVFTQFPLTASATGTGTLYKNFTEVINASSFANGTTYLFLKTHYSSSDAVTSINGETAKLTMTEASNGPTAFMYDNIGYNPSKYVTSIKADRGSGFDDCDSGSIIYTTISAKFTGQWLTATTGTGWYYWCALSGCRGSGPYYAYTYDTVSYSESDIEVTVNRVIGVTDTVVKNDLTVKVKNYTVSDYTITDGSVTGTDRTIGLNVGGVTLTKTVGAVITFTKNPSSTGSTTTQVKIPGTPIYAPTSDSTYSGHTFKGWTLASGSSTVNYPPGSEFNVDECTTLYAVWVPNVYYTVTINGTPQQVESGTTVSAPGTNPAKATEYFNGSNSLIAGANDSTADAVKKIDYTFTGWKNTATSQFWDFSTAITSSLTLLPDYSQTVSYKIIFANTNANSTYTAANQWIAAGQHVAEIIAPSTVISGATTYYFAGWNTMQNGTGEFWNFYGDVVNNNLTLYAQWTTVNAYNVVFDDNLADPKDDYVWNTGSLTQNSVAATGYVTIPGIYRVDYTFDGWHTAPNCNASNAYNINRTLSENNASGIDADNDKSIILYAKWLPKYTSENDILISSSALAGGTYAAFYSARINAFENNSSYNTPDATQVYRNFHLVNSNGTVVNPSVLPTGLFLNRRTGEVYGIPTAAAGNYTFHVRIANDEGRWISLTYPITINLSNSAMAIDMKDDNAGLVKTYGGNDPGFFSNQFTITAAGAPAAVYDADGTNVSLTYDYTATKTSRAGNEATFVPSSASTLKYAPDLLNSIPDNKTNAFGMAFHRTAGEDAGAYKLFMAADDVSGATISNYGITIADALLATSLTYAEGNNPALATAPEYVFTVNAKSGASYSNGATIAYGTYASGDDVKAALISGSGIVNNAGINVTDAFQTVTLISLNVSGAGKLMVGTYTGGFAPIVANTASPKGTSQAAGATTTANYSSPSLSLSISTHELTAVKRAYGITTGSHFSVDDLASLISLDSLRGDLVGLTITTLTLGETTYVLADAGQKQAAETALATLSATIGSHPMSIAYSTVLTGSDAANYRISAGTASDAVLNVNAAVVCQSGAAPLLYPVASLEKKSVASGGDDAHGVVTSSTDKGAYGSDVILTIDPEAGYRLDGLRILDADGNVIPFTDNGDGTFSFRMPANGITYNYYFGIAAVDPVLTGVSSLLETESHNAYLQGYPTGSLKPTGSMTRAEAAQMFYNLLIVKPANPASSFHDVDSGQWFCTAVTSMAELGIVMGFNGNFRPDDTITRAEFAALVVRFSNAINSSCNYTDVSDSFWAYNSIATATAYGWITGSGGLFRPNDNITRAEVSTVMNRVLGRVPDRFYIGCNGSPLNGFSDLAPGAWFYCDMTDATNGHEYDLTASSLELWGTTR